MNNEHALTKNELAWYREAGYLVRKGVLEAEVHALQHAVERAALAAYEASKSGKTYVLDGKKFVDAGSMTVQFEPAGNSDTIRVIEPVCQLDATLEGLLADPRITDPVRSILGTPDISIWTHKLNLKRPLEGSGFGWHQDSPYWVHDSNHVDLLPNVMVALDDASRVNGCFRVIRASHLKGCLPGTDDGTQLGGFYTDPGCFDEADAIDMEVPAGSLIWFDPHSIHGSRPNTSPLPRRALVLTYQPSGFPMLKTGEVRNL